MNTLPKIYIDSNVFYAVSNEKVTTETRYFFSLLFSKKIIGVTSSIVANEILKNNSLSERYWKKAFPLMELAPVSNVVIDLAKFYIDSQILPSTEFLSALHIASASYNRCSHFVTWNYRYLLNISKKNQFKAMDKLVGYQSVSIHSPAEIIV